MRIAVKAQPKSSQQKVVKNSDGSLKVYLKSSPTDGKANDELKKVVAEFYNIKRSSVRIITGETSRNKLIEIQ